MKKIWELRKYPNGLAQPIPNDQLYLYLRNTDNSPAQPGDVFSVQPGGVVMAHPGDDVRDWELCQLDGVCLRYTVDKDVFVFIPDGL